MTDFIIGDIHVPYHSQECVDIVTRMAWHFKPRNIIINGDALDNAQLSRFNHSPFEPASLKSDIEELCNIISDLQKYSNVIYIEGNHESRFQKYINDNAPDLHGLLSMESLINNNLSTPVQYVHTVPSESMLEWQNNLLIGHFNVARKYCGYTAKALVERFQTNVVQGHTHRLGEYAIRVKGRTLRGYEGGCLCDLNPEYVMMPNWQQGFLVFTPIDNNWSIDIVRIDDGRAVYRGKTYKP